MLFRSHQIAERFAKEGIVFSNTHRDYLKRLADDAAAEAELAAEWQAHQAVVAAVLGGPGGADAKDEERKKR